MPLGGSKGTQRDLFTCHGRADVAGADGAALAMARKQSSEQGEGCCLPSSAPGEQGGSRSLFMPGHGQRQLFLRMDPYREGIREGGEVPPSRGAQEQKASEPLREERTNVPWVRGKGGSMGK